MTTTGRVLGYISYLRLMVIETGGHEVSEELLLSYISYLRLMVIETTTSCKKQTPYSRSYISYLRLMVIETCRCF